MPKMEPRRPARVMLRLKWSNRYCGGEQGSGCGVQYSSEGDVEVDVVKQVLRGGRVQGAGVSGVGFRQGLRCALQQRCRLGA